MQFLVLVSIVDFYPKIVFEALPLMLGNIMASQHWDLAVRLARPSVFLGCIVLEAYLEIVNFVYFQQFELE